MKDRDCCAHCIDPCIRNHMYACGACAARKQCPCGLRHAHGDCSWDFNEGNTMLDLETRIVPHTTPGVYAIVRSYRYDAGEGYRWRSQVLNATHEWKSINEGAILPFKHFHVVTHGVTKGIVGADFADNRWHCSLTQHAYVQSEGADKIYCTKCGHWCLL